MTGARIASATIYRSRGSVGSFDARSGVHIREERFDAVEVVFFNDAPTQAQVYAHCYYVNSRTTRVSKVEPRRPTTLTADELRLAEEEAFGG